MAKKLYEESNIQNIADAIRAKTGSANPMYVSEFAEKINSIPSGEISGDYVLSDLINFTPTESIEINIDSSIRNLWGWFHTEGEWIYDKIMRIAFYTNGLIEIVSEEDYTNYYDNGWHDADSYHYEDDDKRYKCIHVEGKKTLTAKEYNAFMQIIDPSGNTYEIGLESEALMALCDWDLTTNSESKPTIAIINHHPFYYLRCDCIVSGDKIDTFVVQPHNSYSFFIDKAASTGIEVSNWRWTPNA